MKTGSNQAPNSAAATGGHCRRIIEDRKSTRLNSSHDQISYAVFCLKKKKKRDVHRSENKNRRCNLVRTSRPRGIYSCKTHQVLRESGPLRRAWIYDGGHDESARRDD